MVAMFMGCDPEAFGGESGKKTGELVIKLSTPRARDLDGDTGISTKIKKYVITGQGPGERTFAPITISGTDTALVSDLYAGDWTVTVVGLNEDDYAIGACVETVEIIANKQTTKVFVVEEFTGEGTFKIEVQWPAGIVSDPRILVEISKDIGEVAAESWVMVPDDEDGKAVGQVTLAAGSYAITISIYDGSTENEDNRLTGVNGSFLIIDGRTEQASFTFDGESLRTLGGMSMSIQDNMPVPFSVALSKDSDKVWEGHSVTLTATPSLSGEYAYYWFIDGILQDGETGDEFELDDTLSYGAHFIGVTVLKNGLFASAHTRVTRGDDPGLFFTLQLLEPGTTTVAHSFDLELSIPNYLYANMLDDPSILEYRTLEYRTLVFRYESPSNPDNWETLRSCFSSILVSDYLKFQDNILNTNDLTLVGLLIDEFDGIGTYSFGDSDISGYLLTDQLDSEGTQYEIDFIESAIIEIVEYGTVGGYVKGSAFIKNAVLYDVFDEYKTLTFDIKANFSFERGDDLIVQIT